MLKKETIAVALSGGVDSSIVAALLKEQGHDVIAITMRIEQGGDVSEAATVAEFLGIEHFVIDLHKSFKAEVIDYFCTEYIAGFTPNPCVRCNKKIKFGVLLEAALDLGADYLATGHYTRIEYNEERQRYLVKKAADQTKDQTYVMYSLDQKQLSKLLMPLGEYAKEDVRLMAREMGLPAADRPESQEICFIPNDDYRSFIKKKHGMDSKPGPFLDTRGSVIGEHKGIPFYTIGQRRGLGLALGERAYVVDIDPGRNAIIVGSDEYILRQDLLAKNLNFILHENVKESTRVEAQIRYNAQPAPAVLRPVNEDIFKIVFDRPQRAVTPGQAVVFYQGDYLLGGGTICRAREVNEAPYR